MSDIILTRRIFTHRSTVGRLVFEDFECWTLEDTMRKRDLNLDGKLESNEKVYGKTAIPSGSYVIDIKESTRFKRPMPYLVNVPLFEGIMIHPGNTEVDTLGCILIGMDHGAEDAIYESKRAFELFFPKLEKALALKPVKINVVGGYTAEDLKGLI